MKLLQSSRRFRLVSSILIFGFLVIVKWADLANHLNTDRDGVTDFEELTMETNPLNPSNHETQSVSTY